MAATAEKQVINIATDTWENYTEKNGQGLYFQLLREIYEPLEITLNIKHMPYTRSIAKLLSGEVDVALGNYKGSLNNEWYSSCPIVQDNVDVALPKHLYDQWKGPHSLKGKRAVSSFGNDFNESFELDDVIYSEVRNNDLMVKMLLSGRTDAIIDYRSDIKEGYKKLGRDDYHIIEGVFQKPSYFAFNDSAKAISYKAIFDSGLKEMITNGRLRELTIKHLGVLSYYPKFSNYTDSCVLPLPATAQ